MDSTTFYLYFFKLYIYKRHPSRTEPMTVLKRLLIWQCYILWCKNYIYTYWHCPHYHASTTTKVLNLEYKIYVSTNGEDLNLVTLSRKCSYSFPHYFCNSNFLHHLTHNESLGAKTKKKTRYPLKYLTVYRYAWWFIIVQPQEWWCISELTVVDTALSKYYAILWNSKCRTKYVIICETSPYVEIMYA